MHLYTSTHTNFPSCLTVDLVAMVVFIFLQHIFGRFFFNRVCIHTCTHVWVPAEALNSGAGVSGNWNQTLQNQFIFLTIEPFAQPQYFYFLQYFWFCWWDWGRLTVLICHSFPLAALLHSVFFLQYLFPSCVCCVVLGIEHRLYIYHTSTLPTAPKSSSCWVQYSCLSGFLPHPRTQITSLSPL